MDLTVVWFRNYIVQCLHFFSTMLMLVYAFLAGAVNHVLAQEPNSLVGNLSFTGALFDGEQIFYGVQEAASLL